MICLSARNIVKSYHDSDQLISVLTGVDLDVESGDLISITGQSGCGKSTLLHILGLLDDPDSGTVLIDGQEITARMPAAPTIRNRDIGFVFQFHYLIEDLTARENVVLPLLIAGRSRQESFREADILLERLGLGSRTGHYPNQLSGGEQQRVALARALANKPKLILADEPTGNLDPNHSLEVWKLIVELNKESNQTFVIVTHDRDLAALSNKTYELSGGQLNG